MYRHLLILAGLFMTNFLPAQECVALLHGLARSPSSMKAMQAALEDEGYDVFNIGYPSRDQPIEKLAARVREQLAASTGDYEKLHFVTHSMGGILVRQIQATDPIENIGRVIMLSPPNKGSEVVDTIGHWWLYDKVNGPAGQQLGTAEDSFVNRLGPVTFECGVITGDHSINWINSAMIPGPDDGKVSVESAKVEGMADYKVVHATHPMIMMRQSVIEDTIRFLQSGKFE